MAQTGQMVDHEAVDLDIFDKGGMERGEIFFGYFRFPFSQTQFNIPPTA